MKIGIAGDWHGNTNWARHAIATFASRDVHDIIQLGDFGLGWPGAWNQYINEVEGACVRWDTHLLVVPGNHENYDFIKALFEKAPRLLGQVASRVAVFPRGFRADIGGRTLLALGGAPSIDFEQRREGSSWWPAEMITDADVDFATSFGHVDIMVTHDAPDNGTDEVQRIIDSPSGWSLRALAYAGQGRDKMNRAYDAIKPKVFAHGHYHVKGEKQTDDTKFLSLDCDGSLGGNLLILDLETLDHEWIPILTSIPE